jgi:hypothetical protein
MAAHTGIASHTDAIYAISAGLPATYDAAGYAATTITYTNISKVESFPEFGSESAINEFIPINGAVEYYKGVRRYGTGPMVVGDLPADPGQVILKAAEASANHYSMKITYPDGEVHYLDVLVGSWKLSQATEGQAMKRTASISLCKAPVIVAAV